MKRLLALALVLAPAAAFAAPTTVTGKVSVLQPRCFRAPCPKVVRIVDADGKSYGIAGDLKDDVKAFDGKTITVKAENDSGLLDVKGFLPGKNPDFITGRIETQVPRCAPNMRCAPKVYVNDGSRRVLVPSPDSWKYLSLDGALVTIPGTVFQTRCAPNARCIGSEPTLRPTPDRNVIIRGRLEKLPHGMNGQTHTLTFENGESILVSGKQWADRDGLTVWLSGKMGTERISGQPMLISKVASQPVAGEPVICFPFGPNGGADGSNVSRGADTDGAVAAGSGSGVGSETTSAGTGR